MVEESVAALPAIIENDHYVEVWDDIRLGDPETVETVAVNRPPGCGDEEDGGSSGTSSPPPTRRPRFLGTTSSPHPRRRKQFCMGVLVLLLGCTGLTIGLASRGNATASKILATVPGSSVIPGVGGDGDDDGPCPTARRLMRLHDDEAGTQSVRGVRADPCSGENGQDGATVEVPTYSPTKWPTYSPSEAKVEDLETTPPSVAKVEGLETTLPTKTDIIKSPTTAPHQSISSAEEETEQFEEGKDDDEEEEEEDMVITVTTTTVALPGEAQTLEGTLGSTAAPTETEAEGCPEAYKTEAVYPPGSLVSVSGTVYQCTEELNNLFCGMAGYEPGEGLFYAGVWTKQGSCTGIRGI
ncbi:hypothetical protein THAOC_06512 [Thalassiosira oceanica]|uniref:Uncharacterized protein n=1 Tax=Thalassiosira oceanica TaxID=159749 RepID=K0T033_THAOC|nr:hypothetical protein THAOC_06512 [Thalassiosira oceanica]|eukprot:EJK71998.1 hypothetical protein THAOC_06512 [Thalassiosira oceanica]